MWHLPFAYTGSRMRGAAHASQGFCCKGHAGGNWRRLQHRWIHPDHPRLLGPGCRLPQKVRRQDHGELSRCSFYTRVYTYMLREWLRRVSVALWWITHVMDACTARMLMLMGIGMLVLTSITVLIPERPAAFISFLSRSTYIYIHTYIHTYIHNAYIKNIHTYMDIYLYVGMYV